MRKIFQCCYTNDTSDAGGNVTSGWRTVAVSPDIPQDALETCKKLQNANSSISSDPAGMMDEFGKVLNLEEIFGDGDYIYVIKTKYGMSDRLGRANMFSHALIFQCRDAESVEDPNIFLTMAEENFKDNKKDAEKLCSMPIVPIKGDRYRIKDALYFCGIGDTEYKTLLNCVYVHIADKKIPEPLFVEYDGTWNHRRMLLYCIYCGMPLSVRRRLSSVSCPAAGTGEKNIIFTIDARSKEHYIIPQTGENNVLSPRLEKRLSRYGFVGYAAEHYKDAGFGNYFAALEKKAMELGDETAYDKLFLKTAHLLITEKDASSLHAISDEELDARLSDALRTQSLGNPVMDGYIVELWDEVRLRKLTLTGEMKTMLLNRAEYSNEASLKSMAGKKENHGKAANQDCMEKKGIEDDTWEKIEKDLSDYHKEIAGRARDLYEKELLAAHGEMSGTKEACNHYINVAKKVSGDEAKEYVTE